MNWAVFTLVVGVLFICAEIFVPGAVLGIIGGACLIISITLGYVHLGLLQGTYFLILVTVISLIALFISLKFFPRSKIGKLLTLSSSEEGFTSSGEDEYQKFLGKEGTAFTDLRPAGTILIEGKKIDATTEGGFIDKGSLVSVIKVEGNKVMVRKL